jgi:hypothetical protein
MSVFSLGFLVRDQLVLKLIFGGNAGAEAQVTVQPNAGIAAGGWLREESSYSFIPLFTTKVPKKSRPFLEGTFCRAPHFSRLHQDGLRFRPLSPCKII